MSLLAVGSDELLGHGRPEDNADRRRTESAVLAGLFGVDASGPKEGRYHRLRFLGRGAMGQVELAEDRSLGRQVALKTLAPERTADDRARARIKREAFSLAQIDHRAVVGIYDVLEDDDEITIVMEYVEGPTLRAWLATTPPTRSISQVLASAAEGIEAAHAQGIVHRDLKPDNIIVQGKHAKVIDFGLARAGSETSERDSSAATIPMATEPSTAASLTRTGAALGTPAYMAPEQFLNGSSDARTDQFAFCVTVWEAFVGRRPFAGETPAEVAENIAKGNIADAGDARLPRGLRSVLCKGLTAEPDQRHANMGPIIAALDTRRRGAVLIGASVAGLAVVCGLGFAATRPSVESGLPPNPCRDASRPLGEVWNAERGASISRQLEAQAPGFGAETARRIIAAADNWGAVWTERARASCAATRVARVQSEADHAADQRCLDAALSEFDAVLSGIETVQAKRVAKVQSTLERVPSARRCERRVFVDTVYGAPPSTAQVRARELNKSAQALVAGGRFDEGLAAAQQARQAIGASENLALDAELNLTLARAHFQLGASDLADRAYLDAANAAEAAAFDELAATIWLELSRVASVQRVDATQAAFYVERADAVVTRLGNPARFRAAVEQRKAQNATAAGQTDEAMRHLERALELLEGEGAERIRPSVSMDIGRIAYARGDFAGSIAAFIASVEGYTAAYGPDHPTVADARHNLGSVYVAAGRQAEAVPILETALAGRKRAYGEDHEKVARTLNSIATISFSQENYAEALESYQQVVQMHRAARDGAHVSIAEAVANVARAHTGLEDFPAANRSFAEATTMLESLVGTDHPRLADALSGWASSRSLAGEPQAAEDLYTRAVSIRRTALGASAPRTLRTEIDLAEVERTLGKERASRRRLQRVLDTPTLDPSLAVRAHFGLGWIDVASRQHAPARDHFERGLELQRGTAGDATVPPGATRVTDWLEQHPK